MEDSGLLTIHLFGGFRITTGNQAVAGLNHARLQELLAYLLLQVKLTTLDEYIRRTFVR